MFRIWLIFHDRKPGKAWNKTTGIKNKSWKMSGKREVKEGNGGEG